ncbi:MAG: 50S ribosomal protein L24e [Candidatus Pacearchaeota archaeon]|nr:50S ribosomal protein L24e [Candidatus Pacearchaeota archaeon]
MTKCVFCGKESEPFKGVHLICNDGTIKFYCSSKCRRNALKLKRDKRRLKWTKFYLKEKAIENK